MICSGVSFPASEVPLAKVTDGTSNTYMVGDKSVRPESYYDATDGGDNENAWMGANLDIERSTRYPPQEDRLGSLNWEAFGSAHPGAFNMVFCDGSVHGISYEIELTLHKNLSNRHDGNVLDKSGL